MIAFIGDTAIDKKQNSVTFNSLMIRLKTEYPNLETVIQVGDFGYWPEVPHIGHWINSLRVPEGLTLYWIDGNHENYREMAKMGMLSNPNKLKSFRNGKAFYVPRGSVLNIGGYNMLFLGGAESIDALKRKEGENWFQRESISEEEVRFAMASAEGKSIDVVVSHEAPNSFYLNKVNPLSWKDYGWGKPGETTEWANPSRDRLDKVLEATNPFYWFFGHYHMSMFGIWQGVRWRCLDEFEFYILENKHETEEN